jgi:hypothetical protein
VFLFSISWCVVWTLAWFLVWRKGPEQWPLWVAFGPGLLWAGWMLLVVGFELTVLTGIIPGVVIAIAIGKLVVAFMGRRNVLARSRMQASEPKAPQRGLVENKGFSLVSVVVAGAIVGIALALAASALIGGSRLSQQAVRFTAASNFTEGVLERVTAKPFESISARTVTDHMPTLPGARCEISVTPRGEGLKEVLVTCSWRERDRPRSVRLGTLVAKGGAR